MIDLEDRRTLVRNIEVAHSAGARLQPACQTARITVRTLQRWKAQGGLVVGDKRPDAERALPGHALNEDERTRILAVANESRFAALPPARIVPTLADEGVYLASESSFQRILRAHGQNHHRGRSRAPQPSRRPTTHIATEPPEFDSYARKSLFLLDHTFKNATTTAPTAPAPLVFLFLRHEAPRSVPC